MNKTTKATLWILGVFMALSLAAYFAACGDDTTADTGVQPTTCTAGKACTTADGATGLCMEITAGKPECFAECTTIGDSCAAGTCYYSGIPKSYVCGPTGTKNVPDACGALFECVAGAQCLELDGTMSCLQLCTDTCDAGDCTDTGFGFSVCVAAAE